MQSGLLGVLLDQLTPALVGTLSGATGVSDGATSAAMHSSCAAVLAGLLKQAATTGGVAQLWALLGDRALGDIADHLNGLLSGVPSPLAALSAKTLGFAFGDKQSAVASLIASADGVPLPAAASLLGVAAPLALSGLAQQVRRKGLDSHSLARELQAEAPVILAALPPSLSGTLGLQDIAKAADAATTAAGSSVGVSVVEAAKHVAGGVGAAAAGAAAGIGGGALGAAKSVGSGVGQAVGNIAGGVAGGAVEAAKQVGIGVGRAAGDIASGAAGGVVDAAKHVAGGLGSAAGSIVGGVTGSTEGGISGGVVGAAKHVAGGVGRAAASIAGGVAGGTVEAAKDLVGGAAKAATGAAGSVGRGTLEAAKDIGGGVGRAAASVAGGVVDGGIAAAQHVGSGVGRAAGSVAGGPGHGNAQGGDGERGGRRRVSWWPWVLFAALVLGGLMWLLRPRPQPVKVSAPAEKTAVAPAPKAAEAPAPAPAAKVSESPKAAVAPAPEAASPAATPQPMPILTPAGAPKAAGVEEPAVSLPKPCGDKRGADLDACLSASAPTIISPDLLPTVAFGKFSASPSLAAPTHTNIADCAALGADARDSCISLSLPVVPVQKVVEAPKPAPVAEAPAAALPKPCGDKRGAELDVCLSASAPTIVSPDLLPTFAFGTFSASPTLAEPVHTNIADCAGLGADARDACISLSLPVVPVEKVAEAPTAAPVAEAPAVSLPKPCGDMRGAELDVCLSASAPIIVSPDLLPTFAFGAFSASPSLAEPARTNIADCAKLGADLRDVCISLSLPVVPAQAVAEAPKPAPVVETFPVSLPKPCGDMRGSELDVCLSASAPIIVSPDLLPTFAFGAFSASPSLAEPARTNIADCARLDAHARDACISLSLPVVPVEMITEAPQPSPVAEAPAVSLPKPCGDMRGAELDVCLSASAPTIVSPDLLPTISFGAFSASPPLAAPEHTNIADCARLGADARDACISLSLPVVPAASKTAPVIPAAAAAPRGLEGRLTAFIGDASRTADQSEWYEFDGLTFTTGSADITPQSMAQVRNIAGILTSHPAVKIKIGGYTDNTGGARNNLRLSQRRADAVRDALIKLGIAGARLEAEGFGEQHPVASNDTEEGRARNRRIAARVTAK